MVADGGLFNTKLAVVWNCGQAPVAAMVYVTVYVPAVLAAIFIAPVVGLIDNPVVEL